MAFSSTGWGAPGAPSPPRRPSAPAPAWRARAATPTMPWRARAVPAWSARAASARHARAMPRPARLRVAPPAVCLRVPPPAARLRAPTPAAHVRGAPPPARLSAAASTFSCRVASSHALGVPPAPPYDTLTPRLCAAFCPHHCAATPAPVKASAPRLTHHGVCALGASARSSSVLARGFALLTGRATCALGAFACPFRLRLVPYGAHTHDASSKTLTPSGRAGSRGACALGAQMSLHHCFPACGYWNLIIL
ncbi:hypothetical protein GUJ93_ZPchr0013g36649 [Zizania palustris]|uniref:Uncharacterized protein n=1 Tax=Zizania palustris TaxID=103762 RepID=A0A8J6BWG1_ZIZPA|nr:hypothetical protein GUJ93_ZPchr0013g36649 [Zizania palustris]